MQKEKNGKRCEQLMKKPQNRPYVFGMLAGFGAISLSVIFFFLLYRMEFFVGVLKKIVSILMPFIYGGVIAYLLAPMCNGYSKFFARLLPQRFKKLAETIAITLSMLTGLLIVYALIIMIAPQLYNSIVTIWNTLPEDVEMLFDWARRTFGQDSEVEVILTYLGTSYESIYSTVTTWAEETLAPYITNIVSGVGMSVWKVLLFLKDFLIGIIAAIYMLANRKRFKRQGTMVIRSVLKPKWAELVLEEIAFIDKMFGGFIEGKIVDSAIIGVLCYIGCVVFKFPNALLVSAIVGVTNVIPFFGPFLGAIPSILLILIESPIKALWFALFVLALQQLDGNVIGPKILGDHTGVSSFWVLFSILLFGGLWGLVGMIIAVPLFAVIYNTIRRLVFRGLHRNQCNDVLENYDEVKKNE
ncbi:MAG: AI-2E family transporter [Oscillospiraceae bacterium]|nr:AI-2E family transporter [Oscillospiraceae bacterium]